MRVLCVGCRVATQWMLQLLDVLTLPRCHGAPRPDLGRQPLLASAASRAHSQLQPLTMRVQVLHALQDLPDDVCCIQLSVVALLSHPVQRQHQHTHAQEKK